MSMVVLGFPKSLMGDVHTCFECTQLPPFSGALRHVTKLPALDAIICCERQSLQLFLPHVSNSVLAASSASRMFVAAVVSGILG
mmetsp:Transcript_39161/g.90430  ORF Transcript_39161/g.90430 Transcript_39161/m.90430 type:complete len:84 (-) Transcript_39161:229-480(-)